MRAVRQRVLIGVAAVVTAAMFVVLHPGERPPETDVVVPSSVYSLRRDGLVFTYHARTASESLFDVERDPECRRNLAPTRPRQRQELREALEGRLGVTDLGIRPLPEGRRHF